MTSNEPTANPNHGLTAKGTRTRQRIIEAAAQLVLIDGVARTTLDDVGAAAGVGRSQLYHYFTDKDALVEAVIAYQTDQILGSDGPHLAPLDTWEGWERWRTHIVAAQQHEGCLGGCPLGSLVNELSATSDHAREILEVSVDRWERVFAAAIRRMQAGGLLHGRADPDSLATATLAALQGGLLLSKARRSTEPLDAALAAAIANLRSHAL